MFIEENNFEISSPKCQLFCLRPFALILGGGGGGGGGGGHVRKSRIVVNAVVCALVRACVGVPVALNLCRPICQITRSMLASDFAYPRFRRRCLTGDIFDKSNKNIF